jgi:hypothetical protein
MTLIIATIICGGLTFEFQGDRYLTDAELDEFPSTCWVQYEHVKIIIPQLRPDK